MKYIFPFEENYYIYKITNTINSKIYIGRSTNPSSRKRTHLSIGLNPISERAQKIHFAINKLGHENFTFEVFEKLNNYFDACEREKYWINHFHSDEEEFGYNEKSGPEFGTVMWNDEDRKRMSRRLSGEGNPMFGKPGLKGENNPMFGKRHSEEILRKLSEQFSGEGNPFYGRKHSKETKKLIGKSSKNRSAGENNPHAKLTVDIVALIREDWKIGQYTKVALSKKYNVTAATIGNIISGKTWK